MQQCVKLLGLNLQQRFLLCQLAFRHEVYGNFQRRSGGPLAVSCLKHIELAFFNGKLHVLHIAVVVFQCLCDFCKLCIYFGHCIVKLGNRFGCADTGHNVFALSVH